MNQLNHFNIAQNSLNSFGNGYRLAAHGRQERESKEKQNLLSQYLPGALKGDEESTNALLRVAPEMGVKLYQQNQETAKAESEATKARFGQDLTGAIASIGSAPPEQRGQVYGQIVSQLKQQYPQLAQIRDDYDEQSFKQVAFKIASQSKEAADLFSRVGLIPQEQKPGKLRDNYMNVGGNLIDLTADPTKPVYSAPEKAQPGFSASVGPNGEIEFSYGTAGPLTKANTNAVQKDIIGMQDQLQSLRGVGSKISADHLTYIGRGKRAFGEIQDKLGMDNDMTRFAAEAGAALQGVEQYFNQYRKEITGAAAAAQELEALKKAVINSSLGPAAFQARYNQLIDAIEQGIKQKAGQLSGTGQMASPPAQNPPQSNAKALRYNAATGRLE